MDVRDVVSKHLTSDVIAKAGVVKVEVVPVWDVTVWVSEWTLEKTEPVAIAFDQICDELMQVAPDVSADYHIKEQRNE